MPGSSKCAWCNRDFSRKDHLKRHQQYHCEVGLSERLCGLSPSQQIDLTVSTLKDATLPEPESVRNGSIMTNVGVHLLLSTRGVLQDALVFEEVMGALRRLDAMIPGVVQLVTEERQVAQARKQYFEEWKQSTVTQ